MPRAKSEASLANLNIGALTKWFVQTLKWYMINSVLLWVPEVLKKCQPWMAVLSNIQNAHLVAQLYAPLWIILILYARMQNALIWILLIRLLKIPPTFPLLPSVPALCCSNSTFPDSQREIAFSWICQGGIYCMWNTITGKTALPDDQTGLVLFPCFFALY